MNEPIEVSFRYSAAEISRAMRSHYASRLHLRLDILMVPVCFVVGAFLWRTSLHWFAFYLFAVSGGFLLILVAAFVIFPMFAFRLQPKFRDEYSLRFDAHGIRFRTEHIDSQLEWSLYTGAKVDQNFYLLYYGPASFTILPKRVFAGPDQLNAFDKLLRLQIPKVITTH